jgi:hypothetical protein
VSAAFCEENDEKGREDFGHDANVRSRRTLAAKLETLIGGKE